ncbi:mitochondrial aaa [Colletotrichum truncatum]|uniref:Mitochondrial aaa n=1 Tax=Colletotrichum truncatum TaxID=5467 RepID=A0ACC3YMN3_COLTU|nr:mitochondrial aaa [Colletotrichum truncatum]KAF6783409.1 mitochondrial aaa [Colletotrichum truncatum]
MVDINSEDTAVTDHLVDKRYNNPLDLRSLQETIDNFPGVSASENENDEVLPRDSLPAWLLDRCITCSDEWDDHPDFVLLRDNMPSGTSDEAQENDGASECSNPAAMYEMETILFEQFNGLLKPASGEEGDAGPDSTPNSGVRFAQSVVRLQTHIPAADECTASFLRAVVKQFAKNTGSDLITLTRDDLEDLANHFRPEEPSDDVSDGSSECSDDSDDTTYVVLAPGLRTHSAASRPRGHVTSLQRPYS